MLTNQFATFHILSFYIMFEYCQISLFTSHFDFKASTELKIILLLES